MDDIPDLVTQNAFFGVDNVDTTRGLLSEQAVDGELLERDGGEMQTTVKICTSISDVSKALNIDASASVSFLGNGVSAKMAFAEKLAVTSTSVVVIASARKIDSVWKTHNVELLSEAPSQQLIADFTHKFGDSYVNSVTLGWEYYGAYVFHATSTEEQKSITASLAANGVINGVSASLDVQTTIVNTSKSTKTTATTDLIFIGYEPDSTQSDKDVISPALDFLTADLDDPVVLGLSCEGYEELDPLNTVLQRVAVNRFYFAGDADHVGLLEKRDNLRQAKNYAQHVQEGNWVDNVNAAIARSALPRLTATIDSIDDQLVKYKSNPCQVFPAIPDVDRLIS